MLFRSPAAAASAAPLPSSALALLEDLGLGKYGKRFAREDVTETSMLVSTLRLPQGPPPIRRYRDRA